MISSSSDDAGVEMTKTHGTGEFAAVMAVVVSVILAGLIVFFRSPLGPPGLQDALYYVAITALLASAYCLGNRVKGQASDRSAEVAGFAFLFAIAVPIFLGVSGLPAGINLGLLFALAVAAAWIARLHALVLTRYFPALVLVAAVFAVWLFITVNSMGYATVLAP